MCTITYNKIKYGVADAQLTSEAERIFVIYCKGPSSRASDLWLDRCPLIRAKCLASGLR